MAGTVAKMIWGNPAPVTPTAQVSGATPPATTPNAATVTTGTSDLFTFGLPTGYTQKDLGDGRYEMFDPTGKSAGYNYKGVRDAIGEIGLGNAKSATKQTDDGRWENQYLSIAKSLWSDTYTGRGRYDENLNWVEDTSQAPDVSFEQAQQMESLRVLDRDLKNDRTPFRFNSQSEIDSILKSLYGNPKDYGGVIGDWEALGQVLNGGVTPLSGMAGEAVSEGQNFGGIPSNNREERVSGTGILYGSTPVFSTDGKLIGYRTDISPNTAGTWSNGTDKITNTEMGTQILHNGKAHTWSNAAWRDLGNQEVWKNNALVNSDGTAFIPLENIGNLGWTNKDSSAHQDNPWGDTGKIGSLVLGAIGSLAGPAGSMVGSALGSYLGNRADGYDGDSATKGAIISGVASYLGSSLSSGDWTAGLGGSVAGSAAGSATAEATKGVFSGLGNYMLGDIAKTAIGNTTLGSIIDNAVARSVTSAVMAGATGKDISEIAAAAFSSAISSLVGGTVGNATGQATGSGLLGNVAGTVAGNLTGGAVNGALTDKPATQSPGSTTTRPTTPTTTPTQSTGAGRVARMIWS